MKKKVKEENSKQKKEVHPADANQLFEGEEENDQSWKFGLDLPR